MTGHTLKVTLQYQRVWLTIVCHEPKGADCRLVCGAHDDCADWPDGTEHPLTDARGCNAALYINNEDDPAEVGPDTETSLTDGMPVEVEWDGDGYVWRPAVLAVTG